jgi:DNA-directed RNA polymerase specialized sigma24 family protein
VPLSRFADIGRSTGTEDETLAERIEFVRACLKAESGLTSLTAEERYVLIGLAHQKTLAEIAAELGRSLDTVHRRKMRGLEKVRACLAGKEGS